MKHEGISTTPLVLGYLLDTKKIHLALCYMFFEELLPSSSNARNPYVIGYTYLVETTAPKWISPEIALDPNLPASVGF
jgi:hypothetical protein